MKHYLLLGAGFSRNWGGWLATEAFEYLLGCPEITSNSQLQALLWKHQSNGGFENALAEIQSNFIREPTSNKNNLDGLQAAIKHMFNDMNRGFEHVQFEFSQFLHQSVGKFLTNFDAIFTLNQDLLLERHYIDTSIFMSSSRRWNCVDIPGMIPIHNPEAQDQNSWFHRSWKPKSPNEFSVASGSQPYFKLHGSSNWLEDNGGPMLIIGGNKTQEIARSWVLAKYHQFFSEYICRSDARLMVIGYGFRDSHINDVIMQAIDRGMKMFVIAPEGGDIARQTNPTHTAAIRVGTNLEAAFEKGLIGASRRSLRDIFSSDTIENEKVMRFINR